MARYRSDTPTAGGTHGGTLELAVNDALGPFTIRLADTNAAEVETAARFTLSFAEADAAETEATTLVIAGPGLNDTNAAETEATTLRLIHTDTDAAETEQTHFDITVTLPESIANTETVLTDSSGNGHDLTAAGTVPPWIQPSAQAPFNHSAVFEGVNRGTTNTAGFSAGNSATGVAGVSGVGAAAAFCLEAKIKPSVVNIVQVIAGRYSGAANYQPLIYMDASGHLIGLCLDNTATSRQVISTTLITAAAHDVAFTFDGTTLRLFIDGVLDASTTACTGVSAPDAVQKFWIGRDDDPGASPAPYPFIGSIDEVRWSNTARYTATYTPSTAPFVPDANTLGLWRFDPREGAAFKISGTGMNDSNTTPTEVRTMTLRSWASGCVTNAGTGNTVNPANANGQNNGVFANCAPGATGDLTNPVTVTTGSMNFPGGLTVISAQLRIFFKVGSILAAVADNLNITATSTSGYSSTPWQGPALATLLYGGEDYSAAGLTFSLAGLTVTQLQNLQLKASYNAGIVALPQTSIQIDAWCIEAVVII